MMRTMLIAVLCAGVPATASQAPTGAIRGHVIAADTSTPLRFAYVVLIGAASGALKVTSTDENGAFSFPRIPADRYTIGASKPPYLGAVAGAKRPARPGSPIVVAAGQVITDVVVRLPPGAAISGVITNERGQAAVPSTVALRTWQMRGAERVLVNAKAPMATTDDRGRYRIAGLPPGDYIVSAVPAVASLHPEKLLTSAEVDAALKGNAAPAAPMAASASRLPSITVDRYAPSYYPGTPRGENAVIVSLTAGEDRQNVDFRLERARNARVEGMVVAADGRPIAGDPRGGFRLALRTASNEATFLTAMTATIGPDGRFAFPNVGPGTYVASMGVQSGEFLAAVVDVNGVDITGLQLTLRAPISTRGQLIFEGAAPDAVGGRVVSIAGAAPNAPALEPSVGRTDPTGAFSITRLLPGRYKVGASPAFGAPADQLKWSLQSVVVDGRDVTDLPLDVTVDAPPKEIVVTYTDRWQEIAGRLQLANGEPASGYTIVIFPADKAYWQFESRRIAIGRPSTTGQFTFGGPGPASLPPGNYLIAAVTDIERGEQFDPAYLAALSQQAVPVTLAAGERKTQDLMIK